MDGRMIPDSTDCVVTDGQRGKRLIRRIHTKFLDRPLGFFNRLVDRRLHSREFLP